MIIPHAYPPRLQKRALSDWQKHEPQLKLCFEPGYQVTGQIPTATTDGQPLLLTSWLNGRPVIMPPVDVVSLLLYEPEHNRIVSYLIPQAELLIRLGDLVEPETFPTTFYQIDALTPARCDAVLQAAWRVDEAPVLPA